MHAPIARIAAMPAGSANLQVLFFGRVADGCGRSLTLPIPPDGCSVAELKARICALVPDGAAALCEAGVRWSIEREVVAGDAWVTPGQEVAFFSMFSGG